MIMRKGKGVERGIHKLSMCMAVSKIVSRLLLYTPNLLSGERRKAEEYTHNTQKEKWFLFVHKNSRAERGNKTEIFLVIIIIVLFISIQKFIHDLAK